MPQPGTARRTRARGSGRIGWFQFWQCAWRLEVFGVASTRQKSSHFTNNLIFSLDKAMVVSVGEHDDSTVWNLSAKMFGLLLHIQQATVQKRFHRLPSRVWQRLNKTQQLGREFDHGKVKRWHSDFGVIGV